jgi:hypothetical protein
MRAKRLLADGVSLASRTRTDVCRNSHIPGDPASSAVRASRGEARCRRRRSGCPHRRHASDAEPRRDSAAVEPLFDGAWPRAAVPLAQARANLILPPGYTPNAEETSESGTRSGEFSPIGNVSLAGPIGAPFRFSATGFSDVDRYFRASDRDLDKVGCATRLEFVDPNNDQGFSPFVAFAPRWRYGPTFSDLLSARQDFNIGFNQRFNFDDSFQRVAIPATARPRQYGRLA